MKKVIAIIIGIVILFGFVKLVNSAIEKNEVIECNKWQEQSWKYEAFYLTKWQKMQCQEYGIIINAPIL